MIKRLLKILGLIAYDLVLIGIGVLIGLFAF